MQSNAVVSYNTNRFEKTCRELEDKIKKKSDQITTYEQQLKQAKDVVEKLKAAIGKGSKGVKVVSGPVPVKSVKENKKKENNVADYSSEEIERLKQENTELKLSYNQMFEEYEKSRKAWNEENAEIRNSLLAVENETVKFKIECANLASEVDCLEVNPTVTSHKSKKAANGSQKSTGIKIK